MPKKLPLVLALAIAAAPTHAEAQQEGLLVVAGTFVVIDIVFSLGATVTGIGSAVALQGDEPGLGWPIASMVTGGLAVAWGGILTAALIGSEDVPAGIYAFALTPLALGLTTLGFGIATFAKRSRARLERIEVEESADDDWVFAPILLDTRDGAAPGLGASVSF